MAHASLQYHLQDETYLRTVVAAQQMAIYYAIRTATTTMGLAAPAVVGVDQAMIIVGLAASLDAPL